MLRIPYETENFSVDGLDVELGIHPFVAKHLFEQNWDGARHAAIESKVALLEAGYQPDGILVRAGDSWQKPFKEFDAREREKSKKAMNDRFKHTELFENMFHSRQMLRKALSINSLQRSLLAFDQCSSSWN